MATYTITIWENCGTSRGSKKAVAALPCLELGRELSRYLVGEVQDNGLLEGDCLLWIENDQTGEQCYFPPAPDVPDLDPAKVVPELLGENRFLEALHIADYQVAMEPEASRVYLLRAFVLKALGSLEWRRQLFSALEEAIERADPKKRGELQKRLKRAKLAKYPPAENPRRQLLLEMFAQLTSLEPAPLDLSGLEKDAFDLVDEIALPIAEVNRILEYFAALPKEIAMVVLKVWYDFFHGNPEGASKVELKLLKRKRKRMRSTFVTFFKGAGGEWPQAIPEFYRTMEWCPPGAQIHLSDAQKAHFNSQRKGCMSFAGAAASLAFLFSWAWVL